MTFTIALLATMCVALVVTLMRVRRIAHCPKCGAPCVACHSHDDDDGGGPTPTSTAPVTP